MIPGLETPASVAQDWERLADATGAPPHHRPGWLTAWTQAFAPAADVVVLTVRGRDGALHAAAPLIRRGGVIASPTNEHSPGYGAVCDSPDARDRLASALVRLGATLRIGPVAVDDPLRAEVHAAAARRRCIVMESPVLQSPYADIGEEGPLALVSRSLRKEIGRGRRRLEDVGELRLDVARDTESARRALDDLLRIEALGWKGRDGTAIVSRPETRLFYEAITGWAASTGRLRLAVLRVAERPVAAELDLAEGDALYSLKMGFDPEFAKTGPGHVLVAMLLEALQPEGLRRYEMLGNADAYKMRWTSTVREMVDVACFAPSPAGLAQFGRTRVAPALARRVRRLTTRGAGGDP